MGKPVVDDPSRGLSVRELAGCITRTLAEIVELRPTPIPEFAVYAVDDVERAIAGVADACSFDPDGKPEAVI
jgi:hypothetical protein